MHVSTRLYCRTRVDSRHAQVLVSPLLSFLVFPVFLSVPLLHRIPAGVD